MIPPLALVASRAIVLRHCENFVVGVCRRTRKLASCWSQCLYSRSLDNWLPFVRRRWSLPPPNQAVILSARGPKRFLQLGGGKRRICFCSAQMAQGQSPGDSSRTKSISSRLLAGGWPDPNITSVPPQTLGAPGPCVRTWETLNPTALSRDDRGPVLESGAGITTNFPSTNSPKNFLGSE